MDFRNNSVWHPTINHTSYWQMGVWHFQELHLKKPCPHQSVTIQPNRMLCIYLHPHFGCLITLQTFSFLLLTDFSISLQTFLTHSRRFYSTPTYDMNIPLPHGHLPTTCMYPPFCPRSSHHSLCELITTLSTFTLFFLYRTGACCTWFLTLAISHAHFTSATTQSIGMIGQV